jgi:hypothetical protein
LAIARLDVSGVVETPVTNSSTLPDEGSVTLIINEPSGLSEHEQDRGRKPHSMMCRSSRAETIAFFLVALSIYCCPSGKVVKSSEEIIRQGISE